MYIWFVICYIKNFVGIIKRLLELIIDRLLWSFDFCEVQQARGSFVFFSYITKKLEVKKVSKTGRPQYNKNV